MVAMEVINQDQSPEKRKDFVSEITSSYYDAEFNHLEKYWTEFYTEVDVFEVFRLVSLESAKYCMEIYRPLTQVLVTIKRYMMKR